MVITSCDETTLITIQFVVDGECSIVSVTVWREVWGIYDVAQEEVISPFLIPQLCPIYHGGKHS